MSNPGNLNADQRLREGTKLPRQATFEPLEHYLLRMMMHVVFTAIAHAIADTMHNLNQDDQAKTCIAHTVFVRNKANLKSEEEPQLPGLDSLETSTLHFLYAKDYDGSSMEKKVGYVLYAKSVLMMPMPDKRLMFIYGSCLVRSNTPDRTKHMEKYLHDATQEFSNDTLVYNSSSLSPQSYPAAFDERFGITATLSLRSHEPEPGPRTLP